MSNSSREAQIASNSLAAAMAQIDAHESTVNAFVTLTTEAATATAEELDTRAASGAWTGVLHGMPIAVKDNIDTAGVVTTSGSRFFQDHVPNRDAPVVERLKRAGAVLVGKAMLHEFCFGIRSQNAVAGQCKNPWNVEHIPGGSSGGSAAAVASDMCVGALGSDTGGSVRLPAAMCGVAGLRPTHGRISNSGSMPVCPSQDTIGPMARRVSDVARMFSVLAGYDPNDPWSAEQPLENFFAVTWR